MSATLELPALTFEKRTSFHERDSQLLIQKIREADIPIVGEPRDTELWLFLRHANGELAAGAYAELYYGWMCLRILWVDEALRGQGLGTALLATAEREAFQAGCHGAWLDTFNPRAVGFYLRLGWSEFGRLGDYPRGHARTFMRKTLLG